MRAFKNYYHILGVEAFAEPETIKTAFRKLARQHHPDLNPGNPQAEEKFKEINEAYEILSSPEKRAIHDTALKTLQKQPGAPGRTGSKDTGSKPGEAAGSPAQAAPGPKAGNGKHAEEKGGASRDGAETGSIHHIFEQFLKKGFQDRNKSEPHAGFSGKDEGKSKAPPSEKSVRGEDIVLKTAITPHEANEGAVKTVHVRHNEVCRRCAGLGKVKNHPCEGCHGERVTTRIRKMEVRIPPKVKNGSRVRIAGEGGRGSGKGENGDLFLDIEILSDPSLRIEGLHVYSEAPISITDAVLGAEIEVMTLEGGVRMTIPPGTQTGKVFRLKERGVRNGLRRGDQFVSVVVVTPENLSPREKELYQELAKLRPNPGPRSHSPH